MSCLPGKGGCGACRRGLSCLPVKGGGGTCRDPKLSCRLLTGTGSNDRKFITILLGFDGTIELFVSMETVRDGSLAQQEQTRTEAKITEMLCISFYTGEVVTSTDTLLPWVTYIPPCVTLLQPLPDP